MALRQNAMASAGAAVAAMIGPDVDTATSATDIVARSAAGGIRSRSGVSAAGTRRVSPMEAPAAAALIDEAAKKSDLLWVRPPGKHSRSHPEIGRAHVCTPG